MSLLRKWMYYLLVIGLICTGPALLLLWKYKIEPNWGTVEVVQAVKPVQRGEVLTPDRIHIAKIPRGTLVDGAILRLSDALNRETVRAIRVNEQLTPDMVNARHLLPGPGNGTCRRRRNGYSASLRAVCCGGPGVPAPRDERERGESGVQGRAVPGQAGGMEHSLRGGG
ncbi:SAF domain-containing protein [Paenibacillus sp. P26]|nr:SAF domain-containing protein [Paenibacillus sp. P26]